MKQTDAVKLLEQVAHERMAPERGEKLKYYEAATAMNWTIRATTALEALFPDGHAVRRQWDTLINPTNCNQPSVYNRARAIVHAALDLINAGALGSVYDAVRADTVAEVLDQAQAHAARNELVAATVLAGGALETHLRHLCSQHNIAIAGAGSIAAYNNAIGQARNAGTATVYSPADSSQVSAWASTRNGAAHDPTAFDSTPAEVHVMIEGIRQFVARTS